MRLGMFLVVPAWIWLSGCAAPPPPAASITPVYKPVVSLNQVMVAVVDHNAHMLWNVALDEYAPVTDADWHELAHSAIALAAVGNTILAGGSSPDDAAWIQKPDWTALTQKQTNAALDALLAIDRKDLSALIAAGDKLTEACESCHFEYKEKIPSLIATPKEQPEHFYKGRGKAKK